MVPIEYYLALSALLFVIGSAGVILRRNVIIMFMCIELMLNAVNLTFITLSKVWGQVDGQIIVFFVMTVTAAEAAVGLALIVVLSRRAKTLDADQINSMKW